MSYTLILGMEFPNSESWNTSSAGGKKKRYSINRSVWNFSKNVPYCITVDLQSASSQHCMWYTNTNTAPDHNAYLPAHSAPFWLGRGQGCFFLELDPRDSDASTLQKRGWFLSLWGTVCKTRNSKQPLVSSTVSEQASKSRNQTLVAQTESLAQHASSLLPYLVRNWH